MSVIEFWNQSVNPVTMYSFRSENTDYNPNKKGVIKMLYNDVSKDPEYMSTMDAMNMLGIGAKMIKQRILEINPNAICYRPNKGGTFYLKSDILNLKQE